MELRTKKDFGGEIINPNNLPWVVVYQNQLDIKRRLEDTRNRLVQSFNDKMSSIINGQLTDKVYDVSRFNVSNFTNARLVEAPKTSRATAIRPKIQINNQIILIPIISQPANKDNFNDFVRLIVGNSNYSQFVQPIIDSFDQQLSQRLAYINSQPLFQTPIFSNYSTPIPTPQLSQYSISGIPQLLQLLQLP